MVRLRIANLFCFVGSGKVGSEYDVSQVSSVINNTYIIDRAQTNKMRGMSFYICLEDRIIVRR